MSQAVIIKSSKNGINLVLDASMPFPELLTEILHKFTEAERFFANASFAISFEGRELSDEEKYQVVDAIMEQTRVKMPRDAADKRRERGEKTEPRLLLPWLPSAGRAP